MFVNYFLLNIVGIRLYLNLNATLRDVLRAIAHKHASDYIDTNLLQ